MHNAIKRIIFSDRPSCHAVASPIPKVRRNKVATTTRKRLHLKIDTLLFHLLLPFSIAHSFSISVLSFPPSLTPLPSFITRDPFDLIVFVIVTLLSRYVRYPFNLPVFCGKEKRPTSPYINSSFPSYSTTTSINHHLPSILHPFLCSLKATVSCRSSCSAV